MQHDLANDDGYIALKWAVKNNIEGWRQRESSATDDDNDSRVQGFGHGYQDRYDFHRHTASNLAVCPSCHH